MNIPLFNVLFVTVLFEEEARLLMPPVRLLRIMVLLFEEEARLMPESFRLLRIMVLFEDVLRWIPLLP